MVLVKYSTITFTNIGAEKIIYHLTKRAGSNIWKMRGSPSSCDIVNVFTTFEWKCQKHFLSNKKNSPNFLVQWNFFSPNHLNENNDFMRLFMHWLYFFICVSATSSHCLESICPEFMCRITMQLWKASLTDKIKSWIAATQDHEPIKIHDEIIISVLHQMRWHFKKWKLNTSLIINVIN